MATDDPPQRIARSEPQSEMSMRGRACRRSAAIRSGHLQHHIAKTRVVHKTKAPRRNDALVMGFDPALMFVWFATRKAFVGSSFARAVRAREVSAAADR
ncbi:hypothetical protein ACTZWT_19225 [Rhodopseudomonas sp. NSM]|uniref:hypothetical protein n=1 Tax=Rhodopseudomonas sp. NSM TaxID=3457630 RepID=UPI004035887D